MLTVVKIESGECARHSLDGAIAVIEGVWFVVAASVNSFDGLERPSVMSYSYPPAIQPSDIDAIKEFYNYKNGEKIGTHGTAPIVDETPQLRNP